MGISEVFTKWIKLLFTGITATVNLNDNSGEEFKVKRGVRQGYPLAPYLFLIVGETFTHTIKKAVKEGRLKITLPGGIKQQCISQYADDSPLQKEGKKIRG